MPVVVAALPPMDYDEIHDRTVRRLVKSVYNQCLINNAERGAYVEHMIALAIEHAGQELSAFRAVVGLAGRERERQCRASIRGNQMNLGGPPAAGLADGLGAVFFRAPVPSGWTSASG